MSGVQLPLPGMGPTYRSVPWARSLGERRYHRHLVFLACLEMGREVYSVEARKQERVRERTRDIHLRHFPLDRGFGGCSERNMRRDKHRTGAWLRRLRRLDRPRLLPRDAGLLGASREELLEAVARRDLRIRQIESRNGSLRTDNAVLKATVLRYETQVGPLDGGGDA